MNATTVSVIIPSAGHAESLQGCLDSLRAQAIEGGIEVVVVLDGSAAARNEGVLRLRAREGWPWTLRWIDLDARRGPAAARNRGAAEARGRYFIFLDDDMIADPDFVAAHLESLAQNPNTAIIGAIKTRLVGYGGAYRYWIERFWEQRHQRLTRELVTNFDECFSGNLAMAAEVARRIGGFDESIPTCEDVELGLRLQREGMRLQYGARALAIQQFRKSPSDNMRDGVVRGATVAKLWRKYPEARRVFTFAAPSQGSFYGRWLRKRALDSRRRWESMASALPWLPGMKLTEFLGGFLYNVAAARGARSGFGDEDQWAALTEGTAVLCYHRFCAAGEKRSKFAIAKERFAGELEVLASAGYRFATLRELIEARNHDEVLSGRTAIVTFDDCMAELIEIAAPMLRSMGVPAVAYVVRDSIGKPGYLSADQIRALMREGWEIGSHSLSHPRLSSVPPQRRHHEIAISRSALAEITGSPPDTFAYPYGTRDSAIERMVQDAGYAAAFGIDMGCVHLHSSPWSLPRFVIDGRWPLWLFKLVVLGGVRWRGLP